MVNSNKQIRALNYLISRYYPMLWHTYHAHSKLVLLIKTNQFFANDFTKKNIQVFV